MVNLTLCIKNNKTTISFKGTRFERLLIRIGHQAKNASMELKIRCLDAISSLLYLPVSIGKLMKGTGICLGE
jgi:hypothetical protein